MDTGYNIRAGSLELDRRRRETLRVVTEHDRDVAAAMLRNAAVRQAARERRSTLAIIAQYVMDALATPARKVW